MKKITINGQEIRIKEVNNETYFCISDIARTKGQPTIFIQNYLRNKNTISILGLWEELHNSNFNQLEFELIKNETGLNDFTLSAGTWVKKTNSIGFVVERGRYGGVYAHKDITIHFTTWFNPSFYLFLIKEFQFLSEQKQKELGFYLNKIMDNSLENNRLSKFLLDGQKDIEK